ncbi:hypothetical protein CDL12_25800 [Handroanthus impetiginosus]|uniref:Leucine-rich repeat protein n=1 Tax=Handroanthus impetiginosus TaxID=429701 RepID=A0A2G9G8T2_9LAMI|nr:hypothetical protein CDL12_25800 [Handroanthus impetiginosus]
MLSTLELSNCRFFGQLPPTVGNLTELTHLGISGNKFIGSIPSSLFAHPSLVWPQLSDNEFYGKVQELSNLSSSSLEFLDVGYNHLEGPIPKFFSELEQLRILSLSSNKFNRTVHLEMFKNPYMEVLDLSHNDLFVQSTDTDSSLPPLLNVGAEFFSVSNNNLTGEIPPSICNATKLEVLDLSANALTGSIPPCLPNNSVLGVLSLGRNNLSGTIPDTFSVNCSLQTLDLNRNVLTGKIPRSLVNCSSLEVLNVGNNRIEDTFPCMLMKASLRVLILRSNKFYGDLQCLEAIQEWLNLQIIDISTNYFGGDISHLSFSKWRGMISPNDNKQSEYNNLRFDYSRGNYYQNAVTVTIKREEMKLTKILLIFTTIDFSNNKFHGKIPHSIGNLKSLYGLNLSHNDLTGSIPASIGNLRQLNSLELSVNKLNGKIPVELASLTFIGFLNLSYNRLFGRIPEGPQLQTFSAASFEGNDGLYGCPVDTSCNEKESGVSPPGFQTEEVHLKKEIDWDYVSAALGFAVAFGSTVWLTLHCKRWREMFFGKVDQIYLKFFPKC